MPLPDDKLLVLLSKLLSFREFPHLESLRLAQRDLLPNVEDRFGNLIGALRDSGVNRLTIEK